MSQELVDSLISKFENKSVGLEDFQLFLIRSTESNINFCSEHFIRLVRQIHNIQDDQSLEEKVLFIKLLEFVFNCLQDPSDKDICMNIFIEEMKIATKSKNIPYSLASFYPNYQSKVSVCLNQLCASDPDSNDIFDMVLLKKIGYELQFLALISPRKVVSSLILKMYNNYDVSKQCVILFSFIKQVINSEWSENGEEDNDNDEDEDRNIKYPLIVLQLKRFLVKSFQSKLSPSLFSKDGYINTVNIFSKLSSYYYTGNIEDERQLPLVDVNLICNAVLIPMAFEETTVQLAFAILEQLIDLSNLNLLKFDWQILTPEHEDEDKFKIEGIIALAIHHLPFFAKKENSEGLFLIFSTLHKLAEKLQADKFVFSKPIINHQMVKLKSLDWIYAYVVMRIFKNLWNIKKLIIPKYFQTFLEEDSLLKFQFIHIPESQDSLTCFMESILEMALLSEFCVKDFLGTNTFKNIFDSNLLRTSLSRALFFPYENHIIPASTYFKSTFSILMRHFNITPLSSTVTYFIDPTDDDTVLICYNRSTVKQLITSIYFNACQLPKLFPDNYKDIDDSVKNAIRTAYLSMVTKNATYIKKRIADEYAGKSVFKSSVAKCFTILSSEINLYVCQIHSLLQLGVPENDILFKSVTKKVVDLNDLIISIKANNSFLS
uniref:MMS19 nucleotide excision repair protein n=1 Tax=Strongyloides stercoralis TaxID=6248 RepID=A0A0K0ERX7_STRER